MLELSTRQTAVGDTEETGIDRIEGVLAEPTGQGKNDPNTLIAAGRLVALLARSPVRCRCP